MELKNQLHFGKW